MKLNELSDTLRNVGLKAVYYGLSILILGAFASVSVLHLQLFSLWFPILKTSPFDYMIIWFSAGLVVPSFILIIFGLFFVWASNSTNNTYYKEYYGGENNANKENRI